MNHSRGYNLKCCLRMNNYSILHFFQKLVKKRKYVKLFYRSVEEVPPFLVINSSLIILQKFRHFQYSTCFLRDSTYSIWLTIRCLLYVIVRLMNGCFLYLTLSFEINYGRMCIDRDWNSITKCLFAQ